MTKLSLVALLLAGSLFLGGCFGKPTTSVQINDQGGSVKINTPEGTFEAGQQIKLPDNVPQYPGSQVTSKATGSSENGIGGFFTMTTSDAPDKVVSFYRDYYTNQGWINKGEMQVEVSTTLVFSKNENENVSVTVAKNTTDGNTTISIILSTQEE